MVCVKNNIKFLVAIFFLATTYFSFAQNSNITKERIALDKALTLIENYEICSTVIDDDSYYEFLGIFKDDNQMVFNDLLCYNEKPSLTVKEYADFQRKVARNKQIFVSNINLRKTWVEDGLYKIEYDFEKSVSYENECGLHFDTKEYYGETYKMNAVVVYDETTDGVYIENLSGSIDSDKPRTFYTLKNTSVRDKDLRFNGKPIVIDAYKQACLGPKATKNMFAYADPDVVVKPNIDDKCKVVTVGYNARHFMIKPHYNMGIGGSLKCSDIGWINKSTSKTSSYGLDFGYIIPSKSIVKLGIFLGVGYSMTSMNMSYTNNDYTFPTSADVDGDTYYRHYSNLSLEQDLKFNDLLVPLYFDLSFKFGKIVSLYFDLGANLNLNLSAKLNRVEGSAYVYGVYPDYSNLVLDENWGFNGFGNVSYSSSNLSGNQVPKIKKRTIYLLGGAGLRFAIPKTPLSIDLGVNYIMGIMPIFNDSSNSFTASNPLVYNSISGLSSTEHLRYFTEALGNVKRQNLQLNFGLNIKL